MQFVATLTERVAGFVAALFLMAFNAIILIDVVCRYVLRIPLSWPAELTVLLFQWTVFLGAAIALRRGMHFGIDLVVPRLPGALRELAGALVLLVIAAGSVLLLVFGGQMTNEAWPSSFATLPLSRGVGYLAVVVCAAMMIIFSLERAGTLWRERAREDSP